MAEKRRAPLDTKERGMKRMIESYEKCQRSECPPAKRREFERLFEKEVLPRVFEKDRK